MNQIDISITDQQKSPTFNLNDEYDRSKTVVVEHEYEISQSSEEKLATQQSIIHEHLEQLKKKKNDGSNRKRGNSAYNNSQTKKRRRSSTKKASMFTLSSNRKTEKIPMIPMVSEQAAEIPEIVNIEESVVKQYHLMPESKLAMSRKKRISSIDTKDALSRDQYKLDNADFELGSAQFDIPLPKFNEGQSDISSPDPSIKFSPNKRLRKTDYPASPNRVKEAGVPINVPIGEDQMDQQVGLFDNQSTGYGSLVLKILTKYVTQKHKDEASIKDMFAQKKQRERIFDGIFEQFAKGKKLQKYDEYKEIENWKLQASKRLNDKKLDEMKTKKGSKTPLRHLDTLKQSVERNKKKKKVARYMQHFKPEKEIEEQYRIHCQALKQTVAKKEISVEQANLLIYQRHKQETNQMVKQLKNGPDVQQFTKFCQKIAFIHRENQSRSRSPPKTVLTKKNKDLERWKKYMQRPNSAVYNSDHKFQRSNGVLDNQFKVNGLYYSAFLKSSNSQELIKNALRPTSAKLSTPGINNSNLLIGHHDINPIPESKDEVQSEQKNNEPKMLNSISFNSITMAEPTECSFKKNESLKKLKVIASNKEIGFRKNLVYDNKESVVTSLQQIDKTYSNPHLDYSSLYGQKTFPIKSEHVGTTKSSGNYTYNDLSYYLNKNAQQHALNKFKSAQNPYFDFKRSTDQNSSINQSASMQSFKKIAPSTTTGAQDAFFQISQTRNNYAQSVAQLKYISKVYSRPQSSYNQKTRRLNKNLQIRPSSGLPKTNVTTSRGVTNLVNRGRHLKKIDSEILKQY